MGEESRMIKKKTTIFIRIFIPLFIVMILQGSIFYMSTVHGDIIKSLNANAEDLLVERVNNRENEIETQFTSQWGNLTYYSNSLNELYHEHASAENGFINRTDAKKEFLLESYGTLYSMLRNNAVNGAFLILTNTEEKETLKEEEQSYYGLGIRDYDLTSGYTDHEDLMTLRCPSSITADIGCSLDNAWDGLYTFSQKGDQGDYFYKPLQEVYQYPNVDNDNFAYFCGNHTFSTPDRTVVSYSIPLISADGKIYGVLGVELLNSYLSSLMPYSELQGKSNSAYMIVQYEEGADKVSVLTSNGTLYGLCFKDDVLDLNTFEKEKGEDLFFYTGKNDVRVCGAVSPIKIYNRNTPFEHEMIVLVGLVREDSLFAVSRKVRASLLYVVLFILLLGIVTILFVSRWLTYPIKKLSRSVEEKKLNDDNQKLEYTHIFEIDQLVDAIVKQSKTINQTKAQSEFFMMISHEIRTPLNAIAGYLNLDLEQHQKNGWDAEYLTRSNNAVSQLTSIADEMLDFTRITEGSVVLKEDLFHLKQMMERLHQITEIKAKEKQITYELKQENIRHEFLVGDGLRIELVIQHLLDNALKFTNNGGSVKACIREEELENHEIRLVFECADTGKGMTEEFCKQICAPFNQSDESYSRTHGGLGIGLYLSRYFINAMNGTFHVDSKLGVGSKFCISMMVKQPDSEQIMKHQVHYEQVRALLIGADEDCSGKLKDLLKRLKIRSDVIADTDKACRRMESRMGGDYAYSLCILDEAVFQDHPDIMTRILAIDESIKIFICTNLENPESISEQVGQAHKVLYKPVFQSMLFDAVMNTFGEYQHDTEEEQIEEYPDLHAMVVDDNAVNADILTKILAKMKVRTSVFENGKLAMEAYESAPQNTYQIIFMDIQMPIMNGYEATEEIRRSQKEGSKDIPIIAVSANAFQADVEKSIASGMNEHLSKPVNLKKIHAVIKKYVNV